MRHQAVKRATGLRKIPERWILLGLFLVVDLGQTTNKFAVHSDSMWSLHVAMSVIRDRDLDLDEYRTQIESRGFFAADSVRGHLYPYFPVGPSLVVVPLVAVADLACKLVQVDLQPIATGARAARIESHVASAVVALTVVVLYAALRRGGSATRCALPAVLVFAFCTTVWSTASRALWQHGPSMLALSAALFFWFDSRTHPWTIAVVGFLVACAWIIRPTNVITLGVFALLVARSGRRDLARYLGAALVPIGLFILLNYRIWHSPLPPYFRPSRIGDDASFLEALAGNLISPARGLFVFSPILAIAVYGMIVAVRNGHGTSRALSIVLVVIVGLHWVVISTFPHWWAGHSYGPRLFTDMLPYFAYFLAVAFARFSNLDPLRRRNAWMLAGLLAATSFWIHFRGANSYEVHWWNSRPDDVDTHPERVWDWGDLQFLR